MRRAPAAFFAAVIVAPAFAHTTITPPPPASRTGVAMPGSVATPNYLAPGVKPDLAFGAMQRGLFVTDRKSTRLNSSH